MQTTLVRVYVCVYLWRCTCVFCRCTRYASEFPVRESCRRRRHSPSRCCRRRRRRRPRRRRRRRRRPRPRPRPRRRRPRRRRVSTYNSHDGSTHARVKTLSCISWQGCAKPPFLFLLKGGSHTRDRFIFAFRVERDCENTAANNIPDAGTLGILRQLLISTTCGLRVRVCDFSRDRDGSRGFDGFRWNRVCNKLVN